MNMQTRFAFLLSAITVSFLLAGAAYAQVILPSPGPCTAAGCPLGIQSNTRGQIGNGLPLPITAQPGQTGNITNANDRVFPCFHPIFPNVSPFGGICGSAAAAGTVMHTAGVPGTNPTVPVRQLTFPPGQFRSAGPLVRIPVFTLNPQVFQVNTSLLISNPRVGVASPTVKAGGRTGPATVTYCPADALPVGTLPAGNPGCFGQFPGAAGIPGANGSAFGGIARYQKTKNQFGGGTRGRTVGQNNGPVCTANACVIHASGTTGQGFPNPAPRSAGTANATVYINVNNLGGTGTKQLPCDRATRPGVCQIGVSVPVPITDGVFGGPFGAIVSNVTNIIPNGVRTGNIGVNGTIISIGSVVPSGGPLGNGAVFQQGVSSYGLPGTTGMLTISASAAQVAGTDAERFVRTGNDSRDAGGNGIVNIIGGALSNRFVSGPNANRTWATYYLPEPGALVAGASALMMLGGCHLLVRRRR